MQRDSAANEVGGGEVSRTIDSIRESLGDLLERGLVDLPLLPRVAAEVLRMTADPRSDAAALRNLIHQDQALASHLLKMANSVAVGGRVEIVSLQQAIARLGTEVLREIAFSTCVRAQLFDVKGHRGVMQRLWRLSLASGSFAKEIARLRRSNVESAFLCGLLHNIGKPVVLKTLHGLDGGADTGLDEADLDALLEEFDASYGGLIAREWALPDVARAAIAHYRQHRGAESYVEEVTITGLAHHLATQLVDAGPDEDCEQAMRSHPAYADLNLYPDDVDALLASVAAVRTLVDSMAL